MPVETAEMSTQEKIKELQATVKALRKRARRWHAARATILEPSLEVKLGAVVIYSLCQDACLASVWAQRRQEFRRRHAGLWPLTVTPLLVQSWWTQFNQDLRVISAMNSFADDLRIQADTFLMESLLAEEVEEQNRKGLSICPKLLLESFVRKWRSRPRSDGTNHWLASLQSDQNMQSQWRRGFKRRWHLEMGSLSNAKCIGRADIRARTETYLRWLRWLCQNEKKHYV